MSDATEIELKLALTSGRLAAVTRALGTARLQGTQIDDVYFDTVDAHLRRSGLVLRLRRDGRRWIQTLKAAATSRSLIPIRGEWEVPLATAEAVPPLDLERFDSTPLQLLLRAGLDTSALAPVFRTRIARQRGLLVHGASEIEVAVDRGELRAQIDGRRRREPVAELELELKSGRAEDVLDLALSLVEHRREWTLVPALRSKAERGYALAAATHLDVARASARGFARQVRADMPAGAALRAVVRHGLAIVVANADALRAVPAAEHVHQARVALRRIRSAIRLFDRGGEDFPPRLGDGLRWLARSLGDARDWDVLVDETLPALIAAAGGGLAARGRLHHAARRARERALARSIAAVGSRRYARLVLRIARWTMSDAPVGAPTVSAAAPGLLEDAADRLFKNARTFARLSRTDRHRVRIHAKRLRYALDVLASTVPERSAADYVEALGELQDRLGELNDASVAVERLSELNPARPSRKELADWFSAAEPKLVARAARQLEALARRPRPWRRI